jgi:hypothetical protein
MKGPRELKRYATKHKEWLKAIHWDSLLIFKLERCKKWRKTNRKPRDGYGIRPE